MITNPTGLHKVMLPINYKVPQNLRCDFQILFELLYKAQDLSRILLHYDILYHNSCTVIKFL